MGPLKTARRSKKTFKHDLILAKFIFFLMNLAKIKSCLNSSLDRRAILSGPMAFDPIHLHKYFHICIYFIHQFITCFSKHAARATATLSTVVIHLHEICLSVVHNKLICVLTRRKMVAFELWMYFSSHSLSIHERRMVGLRTVGLS